MRRHPVSDELGKITTRTQVVHGSRRSRHHSGARTSHLRRHSRRRWVEIPHAGHTSTVEEPAAVTAALSTFLAG